MALPVENKGINTLTSLFINVLTAKPSTLLYTHQNSISVFKMGSAMLVKFAHLPQSPSSENLVAWL